MIDTDELRALGKRFKDTTRNNSSVLVMVPLPVAVTSFVCGVVSGFLVGIVVCRWALW